MAKKKEQYTSSFENKIIHGIKKCSNDYGKINLKLILGVSGGPDSLSLLYSLYRINKLYPFFKFIKIFKIIQNKNSNSK